MSDCKAINGVQEEEQAGEGDDPAKEVHQVSTGGSGRLMAEAVRKKKEGSKMRTKRVVSWKLVQNRFQPFATEEQEDETEDETNAGDPPGLRKRAMIGAVLKKNAEKEFREAIEEQKVWNKSHGNPDEQRARDGSGSIARGQGCGCASLLMSSAKPQEGESTWHGGDESEAKK